MRAADRPTRLRGTTCGTKLSYGGSSWIGKARARGNIETLRSGALRVRVYAAIDPVTKKRHILIEAARRRREAAARWSPEAGRAWR